MAAFMGMRGTDDWGTDVIPQDWQEYIFHEYPNGAVPLFGMTGMMSKQNVKSATYNWWCKTAPSQSGDVTDVCVDALLATPYTTAHDATFGAVGGVVYAQMAEALATEFRPGHVVQLRTDDALNPTARAYVNIGEVVGVQLNGASSYLAIKLIRAAQGGATTGMQVANYITVAGGSAFPDGSTAPESIVYDPTKYTNYAQNFRDTYDATVEALTEESRTGNNEADNKKDCLYLHSKGIEHSGFWGWSYAGTGPNGKPKNYTGGMHWFLANYNSGNIHDFCADVAHPDTWANSGEDWLEARLDELQTYLGTDQVMCLGGNGALSGIRKLAKLSGFLNLEPESQSYGLKMTKWVRPELTVHLKSHPLFNQITIENNTLFLFLPRNVRFCPFVNNGYNHRTKFEKDMQLPGQHEKLNGYSTKGGWKFYHPNQFMILFNVGNDPV